MHVEGGAWHLMVFVDERGGESRKPHKKDNIIVLKHAIHRWHFEPSRPMTSGEFFFLNHGEAHLVIQVLR